MKLVIDIPERYYNDLKKGNFFLNGITDIGGFKEIALKESLANGTPLPKGHGRLIDADALKLYEHLWDCDVAPDGYSHIIEIEDIDDAPTVIEADTE